MKIRTVCPECGAAVNPDTGSRFCLECGADLSYEEANAQPAPEPKPTPMPGPAPGPTSTPSPAPAPAPTPGPAPDPTPTPTPKPKSGVGLRSILISVLVFLVAYGLGYSLVSGSIGPSSCTSSIGSSASSANSSAAASDSSVDTDYQNGSNTAADAQDEAPSEDVESGEQAIDATNGPVTLSGTIVREEWPTEKTMMGWSAVAYWLVLDEPVQITYQSPYGNQTNEIDRLTTCMLEQSLDAADKNLESITDPTWQQYVGERVTVRGKIADTGNAHTLGYAQFMSAEVVGGEGASQQGGGITQQGGGASQLIDLTNPSEYHDLNIFLSNFAEWSEFWETQDYDGANPDMNQVVNWGFWHYALNNDTLVGEETEIPGTTNGDTHGEYGSHNGPWYYRHTDTAGVEGSIRKYLGLDCNLSGYRGGYYAESGGNLYESHIRGSANPKGYVALTDSVSDVGDETVSVELHIYLASYQMVSDDSWYSMTPAELESASKANEDVISFENVASATAVVHVGGSAGDRSFTLQSLKVTR